MASLNPFFFFMASISTKHVLKDLMSVHTLETNSEVFYQFSQQMMSAQISAEQNCCYLPSEQTLSVLLPPPERPKADSGQEEWEKRLK